MSDAEAGGVAWNGTVARSRLFDALSLVLPTGEAFVIATIDEWRRVAGDTASDGLRAEVDRLVREERSHRRAHERYNAAMIEATGGAATAANRAAHCADGLAALSLPMRLALVVAFEHLTILLSREILARPGLLPGVPCRRSRMWRWHASEEIAHGHVAFAVAAHHRIGRARARCALLLASVFLLHDVLRCWWLLCRCDLAAGLPRRRFVRESLALVREWRPSLWRIAAGTASQVSGAAAPDAPSRPASLV